MTMGAVVHECLVVRWGRIWVRIGVMAACVTFVPDLFVKAYATDVQVIADARCVLVGMHVAFAGSPQQRPAGLMISMYYFGRLDERAPHRDTERLIEAEASKMTPADYQSRCGSVREGARGEGAGVTGDRSRSCSQGARRCASEIAYFSVARAVCVYRGCGRTIDAG